eukprot:1496338-Rhodomonas_salina.2
MSGTDLQHAAISLCDFAIPPRYACALSAYVCYAICGTDLTISLRTPYAMCGTDIAISLRNPYAMSGTDIA